MVLIGMHEMRLISLGRKKRKRERRYLRKHLRGGRDEETGGLRRIRRTDRQYGKGGLIHNGYRGIRERKRESLGTSS